MPLEERIERHGKLFAALKRNDISVWGDRFLASLMESPPSPQRRSPLPSRQPNVTRRGVATWEGNSAGPAAMPAPAPAIRSSRLGAQPKM